MQFEKLKKANNKLSKEKAAKYLHDLEKIKIIQAVDGKIYSLLEEGFQTSSKFSEKIRPNYEILLKSLARTEGGPWKSWMFEGFGTLSLSQKSALELRNEMQSLLNEFSARSERERKTHDPKELINTGTWLVNIPMRIQDAYPI